MSVTSIITGVRPADRSDRAACRRSGAEALHVLDVAETTFDLLTRGPAPLSVDGAALGHGLPTRVIALDEVRAILLHPSTGPEARDAVWRELVLRARRHGSSWVMGCVGIALPGLKGIVRDRLRGLESEPGAGTSRVAGDLLSAFCEALHEIDLQQPRISRRLLGRSAKAVQRAYRWHAQVIPVDPCTLARVNPADSSEGHVDLLMESAVRQGVITSFEAEIITLTRLEGANLADLGERLGMSYAALAKRRSRAEKRLVTAMRDEGLRDDFASLMSKTGV
ncbi:sigma-70 family RNA polymerase sigma factor [Actinomadura monticuli]|uniref:Sigma-70 family RNA polymerase sigma factor n=1 Tax=Actinomadura monticuli TaxID=3097367 RepID=A0ABV4QMG1_9ACTN